VWGARRLRTIAIPKCDRRLSHDPDDRVGGQAIVRVAGA